LIVTKPTGEIVERPVVLYYDRKVDTFGILFIGESPVKGYCFDILQREFKRVRDSGEPSDRLPKVEE
jgi:hypothetical protein